MYWRVSGQWSLGLPQRLSTKKNLPTVQEMWDRPPGSGGSPGEGNGNPLQYSCPENPTDKGARQATVHGDHKRARHHLLAKQEQQGNNVLIRLQLTIWSPKGLLLQSRVLVCQDLMPHLLCFPAEWEWRCTSGEVVWMMMSMRKTGVTESRSTVSNSVTPWNTYSPRNSSGQNAGVG